MLDMHRSDSEPFWTTMPGELTAQEVTGVWKGSGGGQVEFDDDRSGTVELSFAAAGSFSDDPEFTLLQVQEAGDRPVLYFDTNPDKEYGYEIRREVASSPGLPGRPGGSA
ncbi:hypothetical protein ACWEQO_22000 [Streptomyces sp. NPDC004051]